MNVFDYFTSVYDFGLSLSRIKNQKIKLVGMLRMKELVVRFDAASFVLIHREADHIEIEFFQDAEDVVVLVLNEVNELIYREVISVCKTLHLFIRTRTWRPGKYQILMRNKDGLKISGDMFLNVF